MKTEYEINSTYQETKFKTICAVLKTLFDIDIEDIAGRITIYRNDSKVASIEIEQKPENPELLTPTK